MKTVFHLFLFLMLLGFAVAFNVGLVDIRIEELNYRLGKVAVDQDMSKTLGIVAKYELIKRRMEQGEEDVGNYELEARMQALTSGESYRKEEKSSARNYYLVPIRAVLNGLRVVMGKRIVSPEKDSEIFKIIEIGYFWERSRKYGEAVKVYDQVLGMTGVQPEIRAAVLLHKAFCHSMMSEYETSKTIYERIINQYPETDAGILSWKLLDFLTGMEKRREQVAAQRLSEFDRAKQYYLLMDYRNSIKHFSQFFQSNPRSSRASEARYFKGRAHEELGEIEEATMEYNRVIRNKRAGKWAREANRRMLMLGEFYEQKQQMAQEARKRLEAYQDNFFMNRIEQLSEMVSENSLRAELLQESSRKPGAKAMADEEIMSLINSIGELDLTGEKEQEERRKELERELIERGNLSKAEVQELKRRRMLNDNPYRRPRALKRVIDGNAGQLRYIYNKRLRRGIKLSGKMIVEMKIQPNGRVEEIEVINSNIGDSSFEKDITEQIEKWRFKPVDESLGEMTLRYPFEFYEEE